MISYASIQAQLAKAPEPPPKRRKYNNQPVTYFGITFDSQKEGARYLVLRSMQEAGEIHSLETQVTFEIDVHGKHICNYIADFVYVVRGQIEQQVVEDVKGMKTAVYQLKKKLMLAVWGIEVIEV